MPTHWSLLKVGQKVKVKISELGFDRQGVIKYIGGVNGNYALNHKYYMPSLESGEGLEPWIGVELTKPLPFRQSHSGREFCGRHWFSCNPESGYWCRSHQISILKSDPKIVGNLERRKKITLDLGPVLKKHVPKKEVVPYYDAPILTDESDEDYLEHDLDFQNWRQTQSQRALRISSEVKKWRKIKEAEDKKALTYVPGHYTISYARPQTAFVSTRGRSSKKSRSRSKSRGRSKSFTKSLRSKSRSARTYREEQTQIRNFLRSASPKTAEYELNNALETVKRAKDYLEKINHADQTVKAHLINKDPTQFRRYLETLKEKDLAKYLAFQNLNAHDDLDNSFERLNISSKSLTSPRYNSKKVMLAAEQQPFKFNKYDRLEGSGHYGPPFNKTKTSTFIDSGLTNCYKGASSIPVQKVDSFYLGYF